MTHLHVFPILHEEYAQVILVIISIWYSEYKSRLEQNERGVKLILQVFSLSSHTTLEQPYLNLVCIQSLT